MKRNYQAELEEQLRLIRQEEKVPKLLLHSCCAPCSSYVIEYLSDYFEITVYYYNPNLTYEAEYQRRAAEQKRLIAQMPAKHPVTYLEGNYEPEVFALAVRGYENEPERGSRCDICFLLRLSGAAREAEKGGYPYFATTLTISPQKNADQVNAAGVRAQQTHPGSVYLVSDFKKKNGYLRSLELSKQYGLYRQDYCGCVYSRREQI